MLIRFASIEQRRLKRPCFPIDRRRNDAEGDVRRIERVMAQRRERNVFRRWAVHECNRAERGLADRGGGYGQGRRIRKRHPP